jgi:tetratricopeptide (TPR) repeat protein
MVRQHPYDGRLLAILAGRQAQARQYAEAAQTCQRAIAAGENTPLAWLTLSASNAAAGDRTLAGATLLLGMRQPALAPMLRAALERCRLLPKDATPGLLAQTICPQGPQALIAGYTPGSFLNRLISWYGRNHPGHSGFTTREDWAKEQPHNAQAQLLWAEALLRNACYAQAETAARRTLTLDPNSLSAHLTLAEALYHQGQAGKAGVEYALCTKAHPNSLRALLGLGQVALDKKIPALSVEVFGKAVKLVPTSADAWIGLGKAYYNQSLDLSSALSAFETARKLAPDRTDFYSAYADALRAQARYAEAEALLRKRLAVAPNEAATYYFLAVTLLSYDVTPARQTEAEVDLRQSLKLEPQGVSVVSRLGRLLAEEGRYAEATPYLESALKVEPYDAAVAMALAHSYRGTGRLPQAQATEARIAAITRYSTQIKQLEDDLKIHPLNANLYLQMARLYENGGENDKARNYRDAATMLAQHNNKSATSGLLALRQAITNGTPLPERPKAKP